MSTPIISIQHLSKSYLIGHRSERKESYTALRDVMGRHAANLFRKTIDLARGRQIVQGDEVEEFWALRDISIEISEGEILGIIGRNGAGKSTLLKILSRITEPTSGRVVLRGRVASLLEVGTGFHPELTGRENIFLNGAILGMSRSEIKRKFDQIVDFAGVERFLDTPVKRYSSGMYVRLAFSVAAHLDPEILVVDEVLAVGDVEFQKKCLGKMQDVASCGRTVIFVSHNMAAMRDLCKTGLVLESGAIATHESIISATDYFNKCSKAKSALIAIDSRKDRDGSGRRKFTRSELRAEVEYGGGDSNLRLTGKIWLTNPGQSNLRQTLRLSLYNSRGIMVFHANSDAVPEFKLNERDQAEWSCLCPALPPGDYYINVAIFEFAELLDRVERANWITVSNSAYFGTNSLYGCDAGVILRNVAFR